MQKGYKNIRVIYGGYDAMAKAGFDIYRGGGDIIRNGKVILRGVLK